MTDRLEEWLSATPARLRAYVLAKTVAVIVMLILLWALRDKDAVVVYMRF